MSQALIKAIGIIRDDLRCADVMHRGTIPPLVTIQLVGVREQARYLNYVHANSPPMIFDRQIRPSSYRHDVSATIDGVDVRITSDQRIDEIVRLHFK